MDTSQAAGAPQVADAMTPPDWTEVRTVLLDMDGVLLDLHFDNYFWMKFVPRHYAAQRNLPIPHAEEKIFSLYTQVQGSLQWYCIDHWSNVLELDLLALTEELSVHVRLRPQAKEFLVRLQRHDCQVVLLTNAHPECMRIKLQRTRIISLLDHVWSTHDLGIAKEAPGFWERFQQQHPIDLGSALFIDDNEQILHNARAAGVRHLLTIRQPASVQTARQTLQFPAIDNFADLSLLSP